MSDLPRIPPHSEPCERAVIGCALCDPEGPERVMYHAGRYGIGPDSFYLRPHSLIWKCMTDMLAKGQHLDILILTSKLNELGVLEAVGGADNLTSMLDEVGSPAMAEAYIQELKAYHQRRRLIQHARQIIDAAYMSDTDGDPDGEIAQAQQELLQVNVGLAQRSHQEVAESIKETWRAAHAGSPSGLPCPWPKLQTLWGGPHKKLVTMVAARKGTGKSTLIGQWVYHLAHTLGMPVAVCPFEDGPDQFFGRMAAFHGKFSSFSASQGRFRDTDQLNYALSSVDDVTALPIQFLDGRTTLAELSAWAIQQHARHKIQALFVDAFKDVLTPGKENRDDIELSAGLTALADRLSIPVIVTAHIRKTDSPVIGMNDIRGSSRLGDDAKLILAIQRVNDEFAFDVLANNFGPTTTGKGIRVHRLIGPERFEEE